MPNDWDTVEAALALRLDSARVKTNPNVFGSYLGGEDVIQTANRIFGFDGWSYEVTRHPTVLAGEGKGAIWAATVRVSVFCGQGAVREDTGTSVQSNDNGGPVEMAIKGCVTDALKRALRTWGNQFGLSLYFDDQNLAEEAGMPTADEHSLDAVRAEMEEAGIMGPALTAILGEPATNKSILGWLAAEEERTPKLLVRLAVDARNK